MFEHDGGLFSFPVPEHWQHEIEDDGTQIFWEEGAGSGTLRVTSITGKKDVEPQELVQVDLLASRGVPSLRSDGVAWVSYRRMAEEDGKPTVTHWWELAHFIRPCHARLALFSYTMYADEEFQPHAQEQLRALAQLPTLLEFGPLQAFEI